MTGGVASAANIEMALLLRAALDTYLASNGAAPKAAGEVLLYTPAEAAKRLGLESPNLLYRRTSDGTWPYTPIGKLKKFSEADLEQIIKIQARDAIKKSNRKSALI